MNAQIMKYIPKAKKAAVPDCWRDDDGYWITLKDGWNASNMDTNCTCIHEDTIADLRYQIAGIERV